MDGPVGEVAAQDVIHCLEFVTMIVYARFEPIPRSEPKRWGRGQRIERSVTGFSRILLPAELLGTSSSPEFGLSDRLQCVSKT